MCKQKKRNPIFFFFDLSFFEKKVMSCEQTRRLATFKKKFGFSKSPNFFFSKKLQKLQKKKKFYQ